MKPNIFAIDRSHLQRSFFGTQDVARPTEKWYEGGHYYQGFELLAKQVMEQDSRARAASALPDYANLGYIISGSAQPAQNDDSAIEFYKTIASGTRNVAMLTQLSATSPTARLVLFRLIKLTDGSLQDNRFSISCGWHYTNKRWQWQADFSGWIPDYETYNVEPSSVKISNGRLSFVALDTLIGTPTLNGNNGS